MVRKSNYHEWLILIILIVFVVNLALWISLPRSIIIPLWTIEGLCLDGLGAVVALLPDLTRFNKYFEPTDKIDRVKKVQDKLFFEEDLNRDDGYDGFNEISQILSEDRNVKIPPDRVTAKSAGYGSSARVSFHYEKDGWSPKDYEGDREHPSERYDSERIGTTGVMDGRVSQRIDEWRAKGHQVGFIIGLSLLATGFALQLCSVVYQNIGPIRLI